MEMIDGYKCQENIRDALCIVFCSLCLSGGMSFLGAIGLSGGAAGFVLADPFLRVIWANQESANRLIIEAITPPLSKAYKEILRNSPFDGIDSASETEAPATKNE